MTIKAKEFEKDLDKRLDALDKLVQLAKSVDAENIDVEKIREERLNKKYFVDSLVEEKRP